MTLICPFLQFHGVITLDIIVISNVLAGLPAKAGLSAV